MIVDPHQKPSISAKRCCLLLFAFICSPCTLLVAAQAKAPKQAGWSVWKPVGRLPGARYRWERENVDDYPYCAVEIAVYGRKMTGTHDFVLSFNTLTFDGDTTWNSVLRTVEITPGVHALIA